jgi:lysophospholipase L1-like esterase
MVFAIGDSHATFFEQSGIMKSHWTGPIHTATIYQLLNKGLNLYTLKEDLARSDHYVNIGAAKWQFPDGVYSTDNIKENDIVFFSFGFNDIQKNINKYAANSYESEINNLINNYIRLLKEYEIKFKITCIPCSMPPNPSPKPDGVKGDFFYGISGDFSTSGTSEERHIYNLYANKLLKEVSFSNGLKFLNLYETISDSNGFLKKEYTTDYVHLQWDNSELIIKINELINKL